jgi:hypothetical protein
MRHAPFNWEQNSRSELRGDAMFNWRIELRELITKERPAIFGKLFATGDCLAVPREILSYLAAGLMVCALLPGVGCGGGGGSQSTNPQQGLATPAPASPINSYIGTTGDVWTTKINHTSAQMNGEDITLNGVSLAGSIIGTFNTTGGFLDVTLTTVPTQFTDQTTGFALDVPGRMALVRYGDDTFPLIPLAPTNSCPSIGGSVTYNYVTIPGKPSAGGPTWLPNTDSTYGTFQVTTAASTWNFAGITQFTLTGMAPVSPGSGLSAGYCGISRTGYTVTVASNSMNPPIATVTMGFGPSGFFLEDNGSAQATPVGVVPSNALGAGVGAIGAIQPSSALTTSEVAGAKYLGFYYEPGISGGSQALVTQLASFGCTGSSCPMPPAPTAMIGGVFPNDDPTQPPGENVTIDLGTQDANNNGLYPAATITVSGINFPAAAVVGSLENKYAVFLIAEDTTNNVPLAIYLFQQ